MGCRPGTGGPVAADDSASTEAKDTGDSTEKVPDATDAVYDPDTIVEVSIEMDSADWDTLRFQRRNLMEMLSGDCMSAPFENPFTWFPATVTIQGTTLDHVGVRKKGLIGSESSTKPGLKVSFDKYMDGGEFSALDEITLNNSVQDPSYLHQCLGYGLWRASGLPSSRCNFAHVTVNGDDLGVYVNVEPIGKDLIRRFFADASGNLYEGRLSDFREGWLDTFEKKTNEDDPDRSDLATLADALQADDPDLLAAVDPYLDVDAFYSYWAMEILLGHWDSYDANTNNFYVYHDPTSGKFSFFPWGIDSVLDMPEPFGNGQPVSAVAASEISHRLYHLDASRDAFVARLADLLDTVWDETALLAEVDRMEALVEPYVSRSVHASWSTAVDTIRTVIAGRRGAIEQELEDGPPDLNNPLRDAACLSEIGSVSGTFASTWNDGDWTPDGSATFAVNYSGTNVPFVTAGVIAGETGDGANDFLAILGQVTSDVFVMLYVQFNEAWYVPGSMSVDWNTATGFLYYKDASTDWTVAGYVYDGAVVFEQAGDSTGAPMSGSFEIGLWG
jgi:hypothetical protein